MPSGPVCRRKSPGIMLFAGLQRPDPSLHPWCGALVQPPVLGMETRQRVPTCWCGQGRVLSFHLETERGAAPLRASPLVPRSPVQHQAPPQRPADPTLLPPQRAGPCLHFSAAVPPPRALIRLRPSAMAALVPVQSTSVSAGEGVARWPHIPPWMAASPPGPLRTLGGVEPRLAPRNGDASVGSWACPAKMGGQQV